MLRRQEEAKGESRSVGLRPDSQMKGLWDFRKRKATIHKNENKVSIAVKQMAQIHQIEKDLETFQLTTDEFYFLPPHFQNF